MGTSKDFADIQCEEVGTFCQSLQLKNIEGGFEWTLFNIYGPVQDEKKRDFLQELEDKVKSCQRPLMIGGGGVWGGQVDFSLIRRVEDKSTGNVEARWMQAFNEAIEEMEVRELHQSGSRYTWSNKQEDPIQSVLVFVNNKWEDEYSLVRVQAITRVGFDHNPLIVDTERVENTKRKYFRFDPSWLTHPGFKEWVLEKWPQRFKFNCLDHWHVVSDKLRRAMKGWGVNIEGGLRKHKQKLLLEIKLLDEVADSRGLDNRDQKQRYELEKNLQEIYKAEEIYWQKRGGEKWILEGGSNTAFFHKCANGRKRKTTIQSLEDEVCAKRHGQ